MADVTGQQVVPFEVVVQLGRPSSIQNSPVLILQQTPGQTGFVAELESALITHYALPDWRHLVRWAVVKHFSPSQWLVEGAILSPH